jgi:hypothetical protein
METLRAKIGQVPQDMVLFNESIYYNIAYGRLGASQEEVYAAARQAAIHDQVGGAHPSHPFCPRTELLRNRRRAGWSICSAQPWSS